MKRTLVILFVTIGLVIASAPSGNAATLAGTKCAKVSVQKIYQGKAYTCIKLGKNLFWDNGVKVVAPVKPPKPTPKPTPTPIALLNIPSPSLGEVKTEIECLESSCSYFGPIPPGSIIVVKSQNKEWENYGVANNVSDIFFKLTSPSGKVTISSKYKLPFGYDSSRWRTAEIGTWSVQIAGWNGIQQTEWSAPTMIQVTVLPISPADKAAADKAASDKAVADCSRKSGTLIKVTVEQGMVNFANPLSCSITVVISGQVNCRATWIPIPVSATFSMYSKESKSWGLGGVFPNALAICKSFMTLSGLTFDGSGGLNMCADRACFNGLTLIGRVS
jgi:hypothetical protein